MSRQPPPWQRDSHNICQFNNIEDGEFVGDEFENTGLEAFINADDKEAIRSAFSRSEPTSISMFNDSKRLRFFGTKHKTVGKSIVIGPHQTSPLAQYEEPLNQVRISSVQAYAQVSRSSRSMSTGQQSLQPQKSSQEENNSDTKMQSEANCGRTPAAYIPPTVSDELSNKTEEQPEQDI